MSLITHQRRQRLENCRLFGHSARTMFSWPSLVLLHQAIVGRYKLMVLFLGIFLGLQSTKWKSSPYSEQAHHKRLLLPLLVSIDSQCHHQHHTICASTALARQIILDSGLNSALLCVDSWCVMRRTVLRQKPSPCVYRCTALSCTWRSNQIFPSFHAILIPCTSQLICRNQIFHFRWVSVVHFLLLNFNGSKYSFTSNNIIEFWVACHQYPLHQIAVEGIKPMHAYVQQYIQRGTQWK